jgi:hypothetical protein
VSKKFLNSKFKVSNNKALNLRVQCLSNVLVLYSWYLVKSENNMYEVLICWRFFVIKFSIQDYKVLRYATIKLNLECKL